MAVKSSGPLSLSEIQAEFGNENPISLSEYYRNGPLVPNATQNANIATSGAIRIGAFYNSVRGFVYNETVTANTQNYNLRSRAIAAGWDGVIPLIANVTINSGVYIYASSTGVYSFDTGTLTTGSDVKITNNGVIIGRGGNGGAGASRIGNTIYGSAGGGGGPAFIARGPITLDNIGTIGGGGGGGGGGQGVLFSSGKSLYTLGGGGGGGGRGGAVGGAGGPSQGATTPSASGGTSSVSSHANGGAGAAGGAGTQAGTGGRGGTIGSAGIVGGNTNLQAYNAVYGPYGGGGGGTAIAGNSNITYLSTGTRVGAIVA